MKMKSARRKSFKYTAETRDGVLVRGDVIGGVEEMAKDIMRANNIVEAIITTNNGCTFVKTITL